MSLFVSFPRVKHVVTGHLLAAWMLAGWGVIEQFSGVSSSGPDHHPPPAVQSQSRVVSEHSASGVGAPRETASTSDLQRLSHQKVDEKSRTDGYQHWHFPCGHIRRQRQHGRTQEAQAACPHSRLRQLLPGWTNSPSNPSTTVLHFFTYNQKNRIWTDNTEAFYKCITINKFFQSDKVVCVYWYLQYRTSVYSKCSVKAHGEIHKVLSSHSDFSSVQIGLFKINPH